jgi:hypothetical protein
MPRPRPGAKSRQPRLDIGSDYQGEISSSCILQIVFMNDKSCLFDLNSRVSDHSHVPRSLFGHDAMIMGPHRQLVLYASFNRPIIALLKWRASWWVR